MFEAHAAVEENKGALCAWTREEAPGTTKGKGESPKHPPSSLLCVKKRYVKYIFTVASMWLKKLSHPDVGKLGEEGDW